MEASPGPSLEDVDIERHRETSQRPARKSGEFGARVGGKLEDPGEARADSEERILKRGHWEGI